MIGLLGLWSHALAALLFGALALWQLRHWNGDSRNRRLVAAFAVTALWATLRRLARAARVSLRASPRAPATSPSWPSCTRSSAAPRMTAASAR